MGRARLRDFRTRTGVKIPYKRSAHEVISMYIGHDENRTANQIYLLDSNWNITNEIFRNIFLLLFWQSAVIDNTLQISGDQRAACRVLLEEHCHRSVFESIAFAL